MARTNRKFVKGKNTYTYQGASINIIIGLFFIIVALSLSSDLIESKIVGFVVGGIFLYLGIERRFFAKVWVGKNSSVYHRKKGCVVSANQKISRAKAQNDGLQPCAKCHKISGMNRN